MTETATAEAPAEAGTIEAEATENGAQEAHYEASDETYNTQDQDSWDNALEKEASILELTSGDNSKEYTSISGKTGYERKEARTKTKTRGPEKAISDNLKESKSSNLTLEEILERSPVENIEEFLDKRHYSLKELWYVIKGFIQGGDSEEEIYQRINEIAGHGSPILVLMPGLASFPLTGKNMEKYSGFNTIRIPRFGPDKTHNVLSHIMDKTHVGAIVMGYSDGEKDFHKYLKTYGDKGLVSTFYGVGSDKGKVEKLMDPSRVFYINGQNDHLAPGFDKLLFRYDKGYGAPTSRPIYTIPNATHGSLVDRDAKAVGDIIRLTARGIYFNYDISETRINLN